jgi:phosphate transport system permease protein
MLASLEVSSTLCIALIAAASYTGIQGSQTSLPTYIWDQISRGTDASVNRAWGAALALILFVLIIYGAARLLAARFAPKSR